MELTMRPMRGGMNSPHLVAVVTVIKMYTTGLQPSEVGVLRLGYCYGV